MRPRPLHTCWQQGVLLSQPTTVTLNGYGLLESDLSFVSWDGYYVLVAVLAQFGIAKEEDTVPTSKQAKLVSKLMSERRADQPSKRKRGKR